MRDMSAIYDIPHVTTRSKKPRETPKDKKGKKARI